MTSPLPSLAVGAVRAWMRLYTWQVDPALRDRRRAEIESDLWEFEHARHSRSDLLLALHVLARLFIGVPDDIRWRVEQSAIEPRLLRRFVAVTAATAIVAALWISVVLRADPPDPPPAPIARWRPRPPPGPPPSPPPPPCPPPGLGIPTSATKCLPY